MNQVGILLWVALVGIMGFLASSEGVRSGCLTAGFAGSVFIYLRPERLLILDIASLGQNSEDVWFFRPAPRCKAMPALRIWVLKCLILGDP